MHSCVVITKSKQKYSFSQIWFGTIPEKKGHDQFKRKLLVKFKIPVNKVICGIILRPGPRYPKMDECNILYKIDTAEKQATLWAAYVALMWV